MTFDNLYSLSHAERTNNSREARKGARRNYTAKHEAKLLHTAKILQAEKSMPIEANSGQPMLNGDVRKGFNAVSGEWWRHGMAIGAPIIPKSQYSAYGTSK